LTKNLETLEETGQTLTEGLSKESEELKQREQQRKKKLGEAEVNLEGKLTILKDLKNGIKKE